MRRVPLANRFFNQFLFNLNHMMVYLECNFVVGASGAVGTTKGSGIASIVKLATAGTYQVNFQDPYYRYLGGSSGFVSPVSGTPVAAGSFVTGTTYIIISPGTTNFQAVGLATGIVPQPGVAFTATGPGSGTGSVETAAASGIMSVEIIGDPNTTINNSSSPYMIVQCLNSSGAPTNPAAGSVMGFEFFLRNSNVKGKGE